MATIDPRSRIINAAGEVFAEKGYQSATVREICRKAGVNLASVNYYFGDKERLYVETVKHSQPFRPEEKLVPDWPEGTPAKTKLRDYITNMIIGMLGTERSPWQLRLMVREIMNPTPACRELLRDYFSTRFNLLQSILDEILPADMPRYKRHQIGFSIIGQGVYYRAAGKIVPLIVGEDELRSHYRPEQLAEHIWQVAVAALGLGPPLASPDEVIAN